MTSTVASVRVRACGKINLTLRVLGIRPDGFHELRTTFQSLALHDTLTFTPSPGPFAITSDDPGCPTDPSNLVWKAAQRLWDGAGLHGEMRGVRVHITKRIPMQAGLGGGSSDAAATLRALRAVWRAQLSDEDLETIGRDLGADVAFFLAGGTVLGVERGDLLFPLRDGRRAWVVLARPDFGVSTRDAYGWWDEACRSGATGNRPTADRLHEWTNDLQPPVVARHPGIQRLIGRLERSGARCAAMSGSGSAVFGLFDTRVAAVAAASAVTGRRVSAWVTRTTTSGEHLRLSEPRRIGRKT